MSQSLAGVQPPASRRTSAAETLMSTNMRAICCESVAIASSATERSRPWAAMKWSSASKSASALPSISTT